MSSNKPCLYLGNELYTSLHSSQLLYLFSSLFIFMASTGSFVRWSREVSSEFWLHRLLYGSLWLPPTFCFRTFGRLQFPDVWTASVWYHLVDDSYIHVTGNKSGSRSTILLLVYADYPASQRPAKHAYTCTYVHAKLTSHYMTLPTNYHTHSSKASSAF